VTDKRFAPYLLLTKNATGLVGTKSKWTTLAFVVGYANSTITWDSGGVDLKKLNAAISNVKAKGGGVIVSFGGASAGKKGSKYFAELAGKYTDPAKLADAYIAVAAKLQSTWLDFDVEIDAVKDPASVDRRHKAIAILQQKRPDIRVSFTVPVETTGFDADTYAMLMKANAAGVRIDVVNLMVMYFTSTKTSMSAATAQAVKAARPFITSLGARIGITPQIGKNPSKKYAHEDFTLADAAAVVSSSKPETDVAVVSFWSLNNDTTKYKGAYAKTFAAFV
jgi:chitinase